MKIPTKVTVEITSGKYTTTVWAGDEKITERSSIATEHGSRSTEKGDFNDDFNEDEQELQDLAYTLDSFFQFDVMNALQKIEELV